jgi:hypothetical protein
MIPKWSYTCWKLPTMQTVWIKQSVPFIAAGLLAAGAVGYGVREHSQARDLTVRQEAMTSAIGQLENQVKELTQKVNQQAVERERAAAPAPRRVASARPAPSRRPADDPRWRRVEGRLADHEQKIASARQEVDKTREDLEGKLGSTKDELSGSIAKNHDELVMLQKRGERDYSEFTLTKSKEFRKVGPVSLALRKADTKHKRYNLELVVDDAKLEKKNVNLYEPVYLTMSDRPQPVELVVNQITKDEVRGYVSQPKYRKSELASDAAARTKLPPPESPR